MIIWKRGINEKRLAQKCNLKEIRGEPIIKQKASIKLLPKDDYKHTWY
jgi:hypothetical protein